MFPSSAVLTLLAVTLDICATANGVVHMDPTSSCLDHVGVWNNSTQPEAMPARLIADVPLLGNGYLGVALTNQPWTWAGNADLGPSTEGGSGEAAIHFYLGSNAMWSVQPAGSPFLGPLGKSTRVALGGVSVVLSPLATSRNRGAIPNSTLHSNEKVNTDTLHNNEKFSVNNISWLFSAEQRIGTGILFTNHTAPGVGVFTTTTTMHPTNNVLTTNFSWVPVSPTSPDMMATVSVWTSRSNYNPPHKNNCCPPGQNHPMVLPTTVRAVSNNTCTLWAARSTVPDGVTSPVPILAAFASTVAGVPSSAISAPSISLPNDRSNISVASFNVSVTTGFSITTAMEDNLLINTTQTLEELGAKATTTAIANSATRASIGTVAAAWWQQFWEISGVSLPTRPDVEEFWCGSLYLLACSASVDENVPAPGLFGPFVTSDDNGWNGDYTLDYNYEATFYGVYGTGHHELARSYFKPMVDGMAAAQRGAQNLATLYHKTCANTALHYNAHITPFGMGDFDEAWETSTGRHMHWNGVFGALLFINHFEYTRNTTFARETTWPLLTGLVDWWSCYLTKIPTPNAPDGYVYIDKPDQSSEGENTQSPQIALAMIKRLVDSVIMMAKALDITPPAAAVDIATHLISFNRGNCTFYGADKLNMTYELWHATPGDSNAKNTFAMYPIWPTEVYSGLADVSIARIAQATANASCSLPFGRPVEVFAAAVRAGVGATNVSYTANDILVGLQTQIKNNMSNNMLLKTFGGGIENIGVTRAINEMLVTSPHGEFVSVFPVWNLSESAAFSKLLVKGGFSVSASCNDGAVNSPITITTHVDSDSFVTLVNPWRDANISVYIVSNRTKVDTITTTTPLGPAVKFFVGGAPLSVTVEAVRKKHAINDKHNTTTTNTTNNTNNTNNINNNNNDTNNNNNTYDTTAVVTAAVETVARAQGAGCTAYNDNCSKCITSVDGRGKPWGGSPCVFLSGPSEGNATCQPSSWWFPPYDSEKSYPGVHACKSCTTPASSCPPLVPPIPPIPPKTWMCT